MLKEWFNRNASRLKTIAAIGAICAIPALTVFTKDALRPNGVPLTPNEIAEVQKIFNREIDTSIIRKHMRPPALLFEADSGVPSFSKKDILFFGSNNHTDDYASGDNLFLYTAFMHEMTHVWRHQNISLTGNMINFATCWTYSYDLDKASRFDDFCAEQQGSIITDYARMFIRPPFRMKSQWYANAGTAGGRELLKKVVEEKFPEARKSRMALEAGQTMKLSP